MIRIGPLDIELPPAGPWLTKAGMEWAAERAWTLIGGKPGYSGPPLLNVRAADVNAPWALLQGGGAEYVSPMAAVRGESNAESLPLLFRTRPGAVLRLEEDTVKPAFDPLALIFFMLTRWEETVVKAEDSHGRFPAGSSVAGRHGFLDRPVVDDWAMALRRYIEMLAPRALKEPSRYQVRVSHDVDAVRRFRTPLDLAKCAVGALARQRGIAESLRQVRRGTSSLLDPSVDPYRDGLRRLMAVSERYGIRSAFYFKAADAGPMDPYYDVTDSNSREALAEIHQRGHEIGFHPGYRTLDEPHRFTAERDRLASVLEPGVALLGGRQHYLRFRTPDTWRMWNDAGMTYDSTLGYAEQAGFRCGTCHPFPVFDVNRDVALPLVEVPLIVMDTTLFKYMGLRPDVAMEVALKLARRCRDVGGTFTLLWHNTAFEGAYHKWSDIYELLIAEATSLSAGEPA